MGAAVCRKWTRANALPDPDLRYLERQCSWFVGERDHDIDAPGPSTTRVPAGTGIVSFESLANVGGDAGVIAFRILRAPQHVHISLGPLHHQHTCKHASTEPYDISL